MATGAKTSKANEVFGKRLREARLRAKVSQRELGILAKIDPDSSTPRINQYERGVHAPDFLTAERCASALGVPTPYLYTRDETLAELLLLLAATPQRKVKALIKALRAATVA